VGGVGNVLSAGPATGGANDKPEFSEVVVRAVGYVYTDKVANLAPGRMLQLTTCVYAYILEAERHRPPAPAACGPPPAPDTKAYEFLLSNPFRDMANECVKVAIEWARTADRVWVRFTDGGDGGVSVDLLFRVGGRLVTPYDLDRRTQVQQDLLGGLAKIWLEVIASKGDVGSHHPGDIVIQGRLNNGGLVLSLVGASWEPNMCGEHGMRKLWMDSLRPTAEAPESSEPMVMFGTPAGGDRSAPPQLLGLLPTPNAPAQGNQPTARGGAPSHDAEGFHQRFKETLKAMLLFALDWPAKYDHPNHIRFLLAHPKGMAPVGHAHILTNGGDVLSARESGNSQHPFVLNNRVTQLWAEFCAGGQPGLDHPPVCIMEINIPTDDLYQMEVDILATFTEEHVKQNYGIDSSWMHLEITDLNKGVRNGNPEANHPLLRDTIFKPRTS
jgi:hypothetical protein